MDMQKVFVFLPRATVRTCAALAARYGSSRSEVLRLAVGEGLSEARKALAKLQKLRLAELAAEEERRALLGRRRSGRASSGPASADDGAELDEETAVVRLEEYASSVRRLRPGAGYDELRTLLELQGQLEGVDPDALDDLVTEALERIFGGGDKIRPAPDPDAPLE